MASSRMMRLLSSTVHATGEDMLRSVSGPVGERLRREYWRTRLRSMGKGVRIGVGVQIVGSAYISLGDDVWLDDYTILLAGPPQESGRVVRIRSNPSYEGQPGELRIGSRTHIAPHVVLSAHGGLSIGSDSGVASGARVYSLSHHFRSSEFPRDKESPYAFSPLAPPSQQSMLQGPVVLEDYSAVGLNAVVLPGSTIGRGAWLGVGGVLMGSLPAGTIRAVKQELIDHPRWPDDEET